MGMRTKSKKLAVQKETLRKLQLRPMTDQQLREAAGGISACCDLTIHCHAPSQMGC